MVFFVYDGNPLVFSQILKRAQQESIIFTYLGGVHFDFDLLNFEGLGWIQAYHMTAALKRNAWSKQVNHPDVSFSVRRTCKFG